VLQNSDGNTLNSGDIHGGREDLRFSTEIPSFISETIYTR